MKFVKLMVITFVIVVISSPILIKSEVAQSWIPSDLRLLCLPAMTTGGQPTKDCCNTLIGQKESLCGYITNPLYCLFFTSPAARKVLEVCNIPYPKC
ncbi:putative non-specific lipid-transfer protein type 2 [Arabidopsis thaliana]|uniref:Bifunctional inhibitor/plant lipid transfer protein/seed storage helical domain-containing protein n=2 Tax=Arabidopsis TaxID=3701 RepID=A0A178U8J3_ARATH|nr:Bifunctional inhibitor/plant lipid transfer protein/seed storage helical domain superfamily [Arabidopsis thaliana x Arabidopsis arenosa]OAO89989.1 hypothetical protein AXX17_AT5G35400 [Arabidopsis thaliana]